jgi:nitrogen regulatory protein P-II 1
MKKIEAVIRASMFDKVHDALQHRGIEGLTVSESIGFGHESGGTASYRGVAYPVDGIPRLLLEIVVPDPQAAPVVHTIAAAARTGKVGDGLISVMPVEEVVRIRTGERDLAALDAAPAGEPEPIAVGARRAAAHAWR